LGLCLRAVGRGLKCCFIQFLKGVPTGELQAVKNLPNFEIYQMGRPGYDFTVVPEDYERARKALDLAKKKAKEVEVLVLDEVCVAVHLGLIPLDEVLNFVKEKPKNLELILTGRYAKPQLVEVADYATNFQLIKHPFYEGLSARKGIDY